MMHVLLSIALPALAWFAGRGVLALVRWRDDAAPPWWSVGLVPFVVGCAWLAFAFAVVGHVRLDGVTMTAVAVASGLPALRQRFPRPPVGIRPSVLVYTLAVAIPAVLGLLGVLTPEVRHDPLFYHTQVPQLWLNFGRMVEVPENGHSYFPYGFEMLYAWGLALGSDSAAKSFHWLAGLAAAGAAGRLGQVAGGSAWPAAAFFYAMPFIVYLSTTTYIDLATGMYGLTALAVAFGAGGERVTLRMLLFGVLTGSAMATKYTAWPIVGVPFGVLALGWLWRRPALLAGVGVATLVPLAPWVIRNVVFVGNPVAPLMVSVFGPQSAFETGLAGRFDSFAGEGFSAGTLVRAPVGYATHLLGQKYVLSLLGLVAGGVLLMAPGGKRPRAVAVLAGLLAGMFLMAAWLTRGHPDGRYDLTSMGVGAVLVAVGMDRLRMARPGGVARLLGPLLAVGLSASAVRDAFRHQADLGERWWPVLDTESRRAYLVERNAVPEGFFAMEAALREAGAGRVIGHGYPSQFRYWTWIQGLRNEPLERAGGPDAQPEDIAAALAAMGVTHLVEPLAHNPGFEEESWRQFVSECLKIEGVFPQAGGRPLSRLSPE